MPWLINAAQLEKFRKSQKSLLILDATCHMSSERDERQEFVEKHIIGAQFFDISAFTNPQPDAVHSNMLSLDPIKMGEKLGAFGLRNDYKIILYDNSKLHTAARALWMLKVFGHNPQLLYILDGGLAGWLRANGKVERGEVNPTPRTYAVNLQLQYLRTLEQMKNNLRTPQEQVIDVRHAVRFAGGPEQRPGLRRGHIPDSFSFPYTSLFDKNNYWRPLDKIRTLLLGVGLDVNAPIITTCGSGTTAPIMNFALDVIGNGTNAVYNGSWTEWGSETLFAGETSILERPVITSLDN